MTQQQICIGDILEPFEELLGERPEPELLTLTEKNGFIAQSQKYNKRVARDDTSDYKVIRRFDIAFNPYLLWAGAIAQNVDWDIALISPLYPTFHVRNGYDPRFIDYLLRGDYLRLRYDTISFGSVPRKRRASVTDFLNLKLPKPPSLSKQQYIADILDRAEALRAKRRASLAQLDELIQSIFIELFGDSMINPKGFNVVKLSEVSEVSSGLTLNSQRSSKKENLFPYLRVANVFRNKLNLSEVKYIHLSDSETDRYMLKKDDVLIVEGHGNIEEIGRAAVWKEEIANCAHQNHIIKVRLAENYIRPYFVSYFLNMYGNTGYFYSKSRTTSGLNTISTNKVRDVEIFLPPIDLQLKFEKIVLEIEKRQQSQQQSLLEINNLFASLTHEAFTGKLFSHNLLSDK